MSEQQLVTYDLELDFEQERNASIIYKAVLVDKELSAGKVNRTTNIVGSTIQAHFTASNVRDLRGSVKGFLDGIILASKTVYEFGSE